MVVGIIEIGGDIVTCLAVEITADPLCLNEPWENQMAKPDKSTEVFEAEAKVKLKTDSEAPADEVSEPSTEGLGPCPRMAKRCTFTLPPCMTTRNLAGSTFNRWH
jgi:hypothetical protein